MTIQKPSYLTLAEYRGDPDCDEVGLAGTEIARVPLAVAVGTLKTVPDHRLAEAEVFFG